MWRSHQDEDERLGEWMARWRDTDGVRARLRLVRRAVRFHRFVLGERLGHPPTGAEVRREWFSPLGRGLDLASRRVLPRRILPTRVLPTRGPTAADESVAGEAPADRRRHKSAVRRAPLLCIVEPRSRDIVAFLDRLVADGVLDVRVGSDPR